MNWLNNLKQKSPKQRFLFILGLLIFCFYLVLAYLVSFWDDFPLEVSITRRRIFSGLLVLYATFRFYRLIQKEED
ncbi:hypothetical protein [Flavobacterium difficile]|uniref:Uncharacterized protein n=1 Tax=Flavobacterium difficile TaxID=2709659 RepID=A0ABX0I475_9FLAO|nr:hypothetical protein [Flavobacterium difficile]NHM01957.1 hypothetical protein [Flavobacterium difficile]